MPARLEDLDVGAVDLSTVTAALRAAGATFAFVHGSRVSGRHRSSSDVDVAAWLPDDVDPWTVEVPDAVDLSHLRRLPLAIAGRIATDGVLLFDDDPPSRVRWQADVRLLWSDEAVRRRVVTADVLKAAAGG